MLNVDEQQWCRLAIDLLTVRRFMAVRVNKIMIWHFFNFKKLLILVAVSAISVQSVTL